MAHAKKRRARPVAPETTGRKKFIAWQAEDPRARSQSAIADALDLSQPTVSDWLKRKTRPKSEHRSAIEWLTDGAVAPVDWMTAPERARAARFASIEALRKAG